MKIRFALCALLAAAALANPPRPKLVVVISVDQLSVELLQRWGGDLTGGLARLQKEGVSFARAYHAHGIPKTAPGHSVLLSGRHPSRTGITENRWVDRATGKPVDAVADPQVHTFGKDKEVGSGPANFKGSTLGGWLRAQIPGTRSFSIAGKDRAAILMAGPKADGVFWFENNMGFTTSTAYASGLPPWLERHDAKLMKHYRRDAFWWTPVAPIPPGRVKPGHWVVGGKELTGRLPIRVKGPGMPLDAGFWNRFKQSPFWDEAILDAALTLLDAEKLGKGPGSDLLTVGLSSTDYIGHAFGTAGEEMYDQLRRLDLSLGAFMAKVRTRAPGAWFVLTSDHGAADFPERLAEAGIPAKRRDSDTWLEAVRAQLRLRFKVEGDPLRKGSWAGQLYINDRVMGAVGATRADMLKAVAEAVKTLPDVVEAATGPELEALRVAPETSPEALSIREQLSLSYVPFRSGDILVAFKPHITWDGPPLEQVAGHGAPYDYDRRVPLFFLGPWKPARHDEPVRTVDIAATLADQLGLRPDAAIDGRPLVLNVGK